MPVTTIEELFVDELRDTYHAEKQLVKALPKMAKAASHPQLKQAIEHHLEETRGQVDRLEQVFELLEVGKRSKRCEAMEGLIEEGRELIDEVKEPKVLDAALIMSAQKVEHYEIAGYGALVTLASQLGRSDAADLLRQTLEEEKQADAKLNELALGGVNADASEASSGDGKAASRGRAGQKAA
jgi:ferritin-like metal-binding protein YciE